MHRLLARQIRQATDESGQVDMARLGELVEKKPNGSTSMAPPKPPPPSAPRARLLSNVVCDSDIWLLS